MPAPDTHSFHGLRDPNHFVNFFHKAKLRSHSNLPVGSEHCLRHFESPSTCAKQICKKHCHCKHRTNPQHPPGGLNGYPRNSHAICNFSQGTSAGNKIHGYTQITFENVVRQGLPHPSSQTRFVLQNTAFRASAISYLSKRHFVRDFPQKCGRCENEVFVRDFPQKVKVEVVKTGLSCETSL